MVPNGRRIAIFLRKCARKLLSGTAEETEDILMALTPPSTQAGVESYAGLLVRSVFLLRMPFVSDVIAELKGQKPQGWPPRCVRLLSESRLSGSDHPVI